MAKAAAKPPSTADSSSDDNDSVWGDVFTTIFGGNRFPNPPTKPTTDKSVPPKPRRKKATLRKQD